MLTAFLLVATTSVVDSFTFSRKANDLRSVAVTGRTLEPLFLSPEDLTNYMAKAHEEKIRAIKEVEDKKNGEIQVRTNHDAETQLSVSTKHHEYL